MKIILSYSILILALVGCQKRNTGQALEEGPSLALVEAKDGSLYIADCLKENGFSSMESCRWNNTTQTLLTGDARGTRSCSWCRSRPYSYYVINPTNFGTQDSFCGYFGRSGCGNYFGYGQYDFYSYRFPTQQPSCRDICWVGSNRGTCGGGCWSSYSYY